MTLDAKDWSTESRTNRKEKTNSAKDSQQIDKKENKGICARRHKGDSPADKSYEMVVVDDSKRNGESRTNRKKFIGTTQGKNDLQT